jgi:hypothetical protein
MSLDKATLKASIKSVIKALADDAEAGSDFTTEYAADQLSGAIADAVDTFVKGGTVTVPATGITAPNGPCTGTATGTIA